MKVRLYAVLPRAVAAARLPRGLEREPLRLVRYGALAFAVGEARTLLPPAQANLLAHDRLIARIARLSPAILPARFGVVVDDVVRLKVLALDQAAEFRDALELVAGGEQMTLRLAVPRALRKRAEPMRASSGSGYLHARAAAAKGPDLPEVRAVRLELKPLVRAEQVGRDQEGGVLTLYHLIDRGRAAGYRAAVRKIAKPARIRISGPFAPYAFVPATLS